jgi:hypothetical protein
MTSLGGVSAGMQLGSTFRFDEGSYSSLNSFDINFLNLPVYRADTKEEFAMDAFMLLGAFFTGGSTGGLKFALSQLEQD